MPVVSQIVVQKEYEKNTNIKPSDIKCIRDWLSKQPHLPKDHITDLDLILAFHCCECCSDTTKRVIDLNYTLRSLFTFYQLRTIDERLEGALRTWLITPLATTTKKGYRAIYCQLLDSDSQKFIYGDVVRAFVMIMDLWLSEEGTAPGTVVIVNMDKVSLGHVSRIDLTVAQQFFYFLQEAMFVRLKEFHFINAPSFMDNLMSMVRPFMKKELLEMLQVHPAGSSTVQEYIPISALPKDAGGDNKNGEQLRDEIWNKLKANENFFQEESKCRVDESKRPGGSKNLSTFFSGIDASFKRLEID
ncbi:alpha-tocopherol transfer protein-like [Pectinophora gossypiella]|uniref:alpha-tocopherol transfer protein-like n=1 Tax=Pectinophora gossypiella TaxID=13191 RepID=UPI00214E2C22|nr:alpha-tocopherol transfer protein-like [Pectinophora gossypiella]XP_049865664.1 alpha-tocopherol transfer protein-like [Pectinophora gossypiella]